MKKELPEYLFDIRVNMFLLGLLSIIALGSVLYHLQSLLIPLVIAVFGTFIINPIIDFVLKIRSGKIIELITIFITLFIFFLLLNIFGYVILVSIKNVAAGLPDYEDKLRALIDHLGNRYNLLDGLLAKFGMNGEQNWNWEKTFGETSITSTILKVLRSFFYIISRTVLVIIFMLFILMGRGSLIPKLETILPASKVKRLKGIISNITLEIQRYIVAKSILSLVTGFLVAIVLWTFKIDFALVWVILTILLNFVPSIGSIIATVFPVTIAFLSTGTLMPALPVLLLLGLIQLIVGNIIDPHFIGDQVNLSPLAVLISLIFWGWLWGIIGMFLAIPIIVAIKIVCENFENLRLIAVLLSGKPKMLSKK